MSQVAEPPVSELRFIPTKDLTDVQRAYVQHHRERLQKTVPKVHDPQHMYSWTLMKGEEPVGSFSAIPYPYFGKQVCEVGLRVWAPSRAVLESGREWVFELLTFNDHLIGQVFPDNKPVLRLLQQLGFRLTGYNHDLDGRVMEVYRIGRGELIVPRPRDIKGA